MTPTDLVHMSHATQLQGSELQFNTNPNTRTNYSYGACRLMHGRSNSKQLSAELDKSRGRTKVNRSKCRLSVAATQHEYNATLLGGISLMAEIKLDLTPLRH